MTQVIYWFELREPNKTPERKGPLTGVRSAAQFCRELMHHRAGAFITVITIEDEKPFLQDGPEWLAFMDGRSRPTALKNIQTRMAAHAAAYGRAA